ncbi:MAG: hypothetical protein ACRDV9_03440, partial [Acidimicrobiia bacterium]
DTSSGHVGGTPTAPGLGRPQPGWRRLAAPVAAVALLAVGLLVGRATASSSAGLAENDPGPASFQGIVPTGFAHTRAGAAAAATNYVSAIIRSFELSQAERSKAIETIAVENRRIQSVAVAELLYSVVAKQLGIKTDQPGVAVRPGILGYKIERYSNTKALVSLWGVVVLGQKGIVPAQGTWGTIILELAWDGAAADWKIANTPKLRPGPAPKLLDLGGDAPTDGLLNDVGAFLYTPQPEPSTEG